MGMTMTQKILAAHAGLEKVDAGQLILVNLDLVLGNDITSPVAIKEFNKLGADNVFDKDKVTMVMDHFAPNKDIKAAEQCKMCRDFCGEKEVTNFFDVGQMGIEHALLPEKGLVVSGDAVIGADSHTCTYGALGAFSTGVGSTDMACGMATGKAWFKVPSAIKFELKGKLNKYVTGKDVILHIIGMIGVDGALYRSMEFTGEGLHSLSVSDRLCMANMAIEAGAKNGIFEVDDKTIEYVKEHSNREPVVYKADDDAVYDETYVIDLSEIKPTVSFPHLPENTHTIDEIDDIKIDQVVIGSCTNGRLEDLQIAAEILKGRKVAKNVRTIIIPATQKIYLEAMEQGLLKIFIEAGAVVSTPTCGPSLSCCFKGNLCDTFNFHFAVTFCIIGFLAVFSFTSASFAEVDSACEFSYHHKVKAVCNDVRAKRTGILESLVKLGRTKICEKTESGADSEKCLFRTLVARECIPLRAADCTEQNAVACKTAFNSFFRERFACCVNSRTAYKIRREIELVTELLSCLFKYFNCTVNNLRADSVASEQSYIKFHIAYSPYLKPLII
jgi:3-isopropylmalate/(R)-2-methylmalate dehydratase large subunit